MSNNVRVLLADPEKMQFLLSHAAIMTINQLAAHLRVPVSTLKSIGKSHGLEYKRSRASPDRAKPKFPKGKSKLPRVVHTKPPPEPRPGPLIRPAAQYSNVQSPYGIASQERHL